MKDHFTKHRLSLEERKEKIIQSSIKLFALKGFKGTTTKEIAKEAAISEGMLYKVFESKKALFQAIAEWKLKEVKDPFDNEILMAEDTDQGILLALSKILLSDLQVDPDFMRLIFYSTLEESELAELFIEKRHQILLPKLSTIFARGIEDGIYREQDPKLMSIMFLALVFQYGLMKNFFHSKDLPNLSEQQIAEVIVSTFLTGIIRRDKGTS
ncbi:MAG: transcriptional regulator, TetR family [Chlamydiales bacterium]|jgi:AcrR family transcriptional regulator|nr:transcriptional regulator, TetR family [Chlamydiales bacterium]